MGIGLTEILVILLVALVVFGPNRLPELSRSLGRAFREFKKGMRDLEDQLEAEPPPDRPPPPTAHDSSQPQTPPSEEKPSQDHPA